MPHTCKVIDDVGNRAGLSHDVAILVREIAVTHIEEGAGTLEEVVKRTQKDIPGAKEADIWNSLGRRVPSEIKKIQTKTQKQIKTLESEARLTAQIDDALSGIIADQKKGKVDNKKIQSLRKQLRDLQRNLSKETRDEAQKVRLLNKIEEVRELLRNDVFRPDIKSQNKLHKDVIALNQQLQDLRSQVSAKATISKLEAQLEGTQAEIADKSKPRPSEELKELQQRRDALRREIALQESLQRQVVDLQAELNDGPPTRKVQNGEPLVDSASIQELKNTVAELKANIRDKKKQAAEVRRLADLEKRIANIEKGIRPRPAPKRTRSPALAEAQDQYRKALTLLNTQETIVNLKEQIRTKDYKAPVPREKSAISDELDAAIREKIRLQRSIKDLIEQNRKRSIVDKVAVELNFALRALLLSGEAGYTGRQAAVWTINIRTFPVSVKNIYKTIMQGISEIGAERINMQIRQDPRFLDAQRSKVVYRELDHEITGAEEYTQSWLIRKIPGLREFIAINDRLMVTYMNLMIHDIYYSYADANPHATREQRTEMAHLTNVSTGRGTALGADAWARAATLIMLAPRFMISRIQAPFSAIKVLIKGDAGQRLFIAKSWGGFLATGTSLMFLASMIPGVEIGDDPESSDFMKILWGNKRIDIWGGFLQPVQLYMKITSKILGNADIRESKRRGRPKDLKNEIGGFIGNRTSPLVNVLNMLYFEKTFIGEEVPLIKDMFEGDIEGVIKDFGIFAKELATPIIIQETVDAYKLEGIGGATLSFFLNQAGIGTSTYEIKSKKSKK